MIKKITLVAGILLHSLLANSQNIPNYIPQTGLVAWMPFSGNANDETSNGNNALLIRATLTTDRYGNPNSAYDFDGFSHQYIMCKNMNLPVGSSARTFAMWMSYKGVVATGESLTSFGYGQQTTSNSSMLGLYDGKARFMSWGNDFDVTYAYPTNTWMHLAGTFDGTTAKLYVNGQLIGSGNRSNWNTLSSSNFFIGTRPDSLNSFFNGKLDDLGIWSRALTASEVLAVYESKVPPVLPNHVPTLDLLAWFPFNGNAQDESGNGNNAIANTAQLTNDKYSNSNSAYQFNANDGDYIKCSNMNMPLGKTSRTFSMWLYPNDAITSTETMTAFAYGVQTTRHAQMLGLWEGKIRYLSWLDEMDRLYPYVSNTWYHLVSTYDGNIAKLFVNGTLLDSASLPNWDTQNSTNLFIGTRPDAANSFFNGKIDDIGVWGRVLTQSEISKLYIGPTTSIKELHTPIRHVIFPNPAKDFVQIGNLKSNLNRVEVYSISGNLVLNTNLDSDGKLNISSLETGLYFVRLAGVDQAFIKLIKE